MPDPQLVQAANVLVAASVPIILGILGWVLNSRLKSIDQAQWQNRKIIELRLDVFKDVSPRLNSMFCYCMYVGDWKQHSPEEIVLMKRQTDKTMHVYRYLLSSDLFEAYQAFMSAIFQTFNGPDADARIRTCLTSDAGNRPATYHGKWHPEWERFVASERPVAKEQLRADYEALMEQFRACIGLKPF